MSLRDTFTNLVAASFGRNPWPAAGRLGYVGASTLLVVAFLTLLGANVRVLRGQPLYNYVENDYLAYFTGARLLLDGHVHTLFEPAPQYALQRALLQALGSDAPELIAYMNPPLWAGAVALLAPLGLVASAWVYRLLTLAVSLVAVWALARQQWSVPGAIRAALAVLWLFPVVQFWLYGNMGALLIAAFAGWIVLARADRPLAAGLALSLLGLKPQYVIFPALYLLWKRQWHQLAGLALGASVQVVATIALYLPTGRLPGPDDLRRIMALNAAESASFLQGQLNVRGALWHLIPGASPIVAGLALVLVTLAISAFVLWALGRRWQPRSPAFGWEMLAVAVMANLTAPHNQLSGLNLLVPAAVLLLAVPAETLPFRERLRGLLACSLALPSVAILLASLSPWLYLYAGWCTLLASLGLALVATRQPTVGDGLSPSPVTRGDVVIDPTLRSGGITPALSLAGTSPIRSST